MLKTTVGLWLIGGWAAVVAVAVGVSVAMHATLSTITFLLAFGVAPALLTMMLWNSAASPTIAEVLHAVDMTEGRP